MKKVLKTEPLVNIIFDKLNWQDKLNFSLCCKKLYSFFQKRNKILKTSIECNHTHHIKEIKIPLLKNILSKYINIKEIETSFGDNNLKILENSNLVNLEKLKFNGNSSNIGSFINKFRLKELRLEWKKRKHII